MFIYLFGSRSSLLCYDSPVTNFTSTWYLIYSWSLLNNVELDCWYKYNLNCITQTLIYNLDRQFVTCWFTLWIAILKKWVWDVFILHPNFLQIVSARLRTRSRRIILLLASLKVLLSLRWQPTILLAVVSFVKLTKIIITFFLFNKLWILVSFPCLPLHWLIN